VFGFEEIPISEDDAKLGDAESAKNHYRSFAMPEIGSARPKASRRKSVSHRSP
jgi:hypothetical protein